MENASDAIIMAGAMLIFVIALTVAMTVFSQARATVDTVVYTADETNYYEPLEGTNTNVKNRIVGLETVIPTLYKYYKENYTVVFLDNAGNPLPLYETKTNQKLWTGSTDTKNAPILSKYYGDKADSNKTTNVVCSFDVDEETKRHEPWTGSTIDYKANLDAFLEGKEFKYPDGSDEKYDYSIIGGLLSRFAGKKFIETIGEYSINDKHHTELSSQLDAGIRNNKNKRVIVYKEK